MKTYIFLGMAMQSFIVGILWLVGIIPSPLHQLTVGAIFLVITLALRHKSQTGRWL